MKKHDRKLKLSADSIRILTGGDLVDIHGGLSRFTPCCKTQVYTFCGPDTNC